VIDSTI